MIHLTGVPTLNGMILPRPDLGAAMEVAWVDESRTRTYESGLVERVGAPRLRGRLAFGWRYLAPDTAALILGELQAPTLTLTPRTRADGDPDWAEEVTLAVCVTSDLPSVAQLASGTAALVVEMETLATFAQVPGSVYGGFYATEIDGGIDLTPYGEATLEPGDDYLVTFLGVPYTLASYDLGTPAVVALRTRPSTVPGAVTLVTTPAP